MSLKELCLSDGLFGVPKDVLRYPSLESKQFMLINDADLLSSNP